MTNVPQSPYSGDRWIISDRKFHLHASLEAAEAELKRLSEKSPDKCFRIHRVKTSLQNDGAFPEMLSAVKEAEAYIRCHVTQIMPKGGVLDGKTALRVISAALDKATVRKDAL